MLIDEFMPEYDVSSRYTRKVNATPKKIYPALRQLDLSRAPISALLFRLRGLPSSALRFDGMQKMGFTQLADVPPREWVLGLAGQFWKLTGGIVRLTSNEFSAFSQPGYALAMWNFWLEPHTTHTLVGTETRVRCTDDASRRRFRAYWWLIGPFSGLIRREMLTLIAKSTE